MVVVGAVAGLVHAGCGKKAPPLAPFVDEPAAVADLSARRLGSDVFLEFTVPRQNSDGREPADVSEMLVYGFTGKPVDELGLPLEDEEFLEFATLVDTVAVRPPPLEVEDEEDESDEDGEGEQSGRYVGNEAQPFRELVEPPPLMFGPPDPRPGQGEPVSVRAVLDEAALIPTVVDTGREPPEPDEDEGVAIVDLYDFAEPPAIDVRILAPLRRFFATAGLSARGRIGPLSPKLELPLYALPPPPSVPTLHYTENEISLDWLPPSGAPRRIQEPAVLPVAAPLDPAAPAAAPVPPRLPGRPIFDQLAPYRYNVYELKPVEDRRAAPQPLNLTPLTEPSYTDLRVDLRARRCYVVRTMSTYDTVVLESEASEPACVGFVDTFAPAAPVGLGAVGSEGGISLIWNANTEEDLAGYLILRGTPTSETLAPLTLAPIAETTYRDTDVRSGERYMYAVVAVDAAIPPNRSAESNRVTDTAR